MGAWLIPAVLGAVGLVQQNKANKAQAAAVQAQAAADKLRGELQAERFDYQAVVAKTRALEEAAFGVKKSQNVYREVQLLLSKARAVSAAYGGEADIDLIGDIAEEGEYNRAMAIWEGNLNAEQFRREAKEKKMAAEHARIAGAIGEQTGALEAKAVRLGGQATLLSDAGSLFTKYGDNLFPGQ
jgi:hypothetical protein